MHPPSPTEINRANTLFWEQKTAEFERDYADPEIRKKVSALVQFEADTDVPGPFRWGLEAATDLYARGLQYFSMKSAFDALKSKIPVVPAEDVWRYEQAQRRRPFDGRWAPRGVGPIGEIMSNFLACKPDAKFPQFWLYLRSHVDQGIVDQVTEIKVLYWVKGKEKVVQRSTLESAFSRMKAAMRRAPGTRS